MLIVLAMVGGLVAASTSSTVGAQLFRCGGRPATIIGTDGPDMLRGTRGNDVIVAFGGNDRVVGRGGRDVVCAGPGNDRVTMGGGNDRVIGDDGNDRIDGGGGRDVLVGSAGDDQLVGGKGNDRIDGGPGDDRIGGGAGNDRIVGGGGFDSCGPASIPGREPGGVFGPARAARSCEVEAISLRRQEVLFDTMRWQIVSATVSFESPFTFGEPFQDPVFTSQRRLFVEVRVTTERPSSSVTYDGRQLFLRLSNGDEIAHDGRSVSVPAGSTVEATLSFPLLSDSRVAGSSLLLGSSAVERQLLPLDRATPADRFPLVGGIDPQTRSAEMGICVWPASVHVSNARWLLELPPSVDARTAGPAATRQYRPPAGSRFLLIRVDVTAVPRPGIGGCRGINVDDEDLRISIDGLTPGPHSSHRGLLDEGETASLDVAFVVPADSRVVTVLIGSPGAQIAEFPVVVPDLSR